MKENDEYQWVNYTDEYSSQLKEMKRDDDWDFFISDAFVTTSVPIICLDEVFCQEGVVPTEGRIEVKFEIFMCILELNI